MSTVDPIVCVCGHDMVRSNFAAWSNHTQTVVHVTGAWSCDTPNCMGNVKEIHSLRLEKAMRELRKIIGRERL